MRNATVVLVSVVSLLSGAVASAFDHGHTGWDRLLREHVVWVNGGTASQVDYAGFQRDSHELGAYLDTLSAVTPGEFGDWTRDQRLAFLINAYNAFTVELILTRYPNLTSIKELGSLFRSPWKKKFFILLGKQRHLDDVEHGMIRASGVYREPRIHVAVVCASVGCPALRNEAFVARMLDAQLEDSLRRFLSDRSRNRYDSGSGNLEVSAIFKWYREDFTRGDAGFHSLESMFAKYADWLAESSVERQRIREQGVSIKYLEYDWRLNDRRS